MNFAYDWYQGTIHQADYDEIIYGLAAHLPGSDVAPNTPKNGYTHGAAIVRGGTTHATIWYGGNPGVHVKATGSHAPEVAMFMRQYEHRVSRVDAKLDFDEVGFFDWVAYAFIRYAEGNGIKINQQGDWVRKQGRTLYLGSRSSTAQLVLYEKGYELRRKGAEDASLNLVRIEARAMPKGQAGYEVSQWSPRDVFGASRWMASLLQSFGFDEIIPRSIGGVRKPTDQQRQRAALIKQYGRIISEWAEQSGSWEQLGLELQDAIADQTKRERQIV